MARRRQLRPFLPISATQASWLQREPDLFELRVAAPRKPREGQPLRVRVRAVHPVSGQPVGGVRVTGKVEFDDGKQPELAAEAVTDSDGNATLDFKLPASVEDDDCDITVTARRGDFEQEASQELDLDHSLQFLITTDKPLYQPGQTLHARALVLDSARRAVAGLDAVLEIEDEENETVFRAPLKTSRFGVASVDWPIPEGARLGSYLVRVEVDNEKYEDEEGAASVRVSRYELPNFAVAAQPDRPYYLPGQSALVEIKADYLFGQPVRRARVRVVRETERRWNYKEQKYDVREGAKHEGEFDESGRFRVRLSLADEFKRLGEESWLRFADAGYAAYVTDPTTNRTEQRRFTLRVSRDPVHLYVTEGGYAQAEGLPLALYVSTYYPDGTPAECEVRVSGEAEVFAPRRAGDESAAPLRTVKTNRYGVAKVAGPVVPRGETGETKRRSLRLRFEARDREGRAGRLEEEFWMRAGAPVVRVETDKVIYAAGDPVFAEIASDEPGLPLVVDAVVDGRALHSERVRLDGGGRARLVVPYRPGFENRVNVVAYAADIPENNYDDSYASGAHTVIYPRDRELKLDLRFERATYEPGEEAGATARVRT
ncbi:MAG TPA: MG2 domain-containing protein, partial [Pyrinomonadaceae bacterium]